MLVVSWAITRVHLFYAVVNSGFYQFLVATDWARFEDLVIHSEYVKSAQASSDLQIRSLNAVFTRWICLHIFIIREICTARH